MTITRKETVVLAYAKYKGSYYNLCAHPFRPEENGLMCLGRAKPDGADDYYDGNMSEADLKAWHKETLDLLNENVPTNGDKVIKGTGEPSDNIGTVQTLGEPWYAVFEFNPTGSDEGGGLWVGRFFGGQSVPYLNEDDEGIYVVTLDDPAEDADGAPRVTGTKADRSLVIGSRPKREGGVQASAEHGPGAAGSGGRRIQW